MCSWIHRSRYKLRKCKKKANVAKRQAELAAWKRIWEVQKVEYERKRQSLAAKGIAMARAGLLPLLMNVVLEQSMGQSDIGSGRPVNKQNI